MLIRMLVRLAAVAVAFVLTAWLVPDIDVSGGPLGLLVLAAIFGVVNALLGPVLRLFSLPITVATLGLFGLVVNGILFAVVAGISDHLDVGGFLWTIVAALVVGVLAAVVDAILTRLLGLPTS